MGFISVFLFPRLFFVSKLQKQGKEEVASLNQDYRIQILIEQLKELLSSSPDMSAALRDIPVLYQKHFGVKLNLNLFGVNDIVDMKERLQGFIEVRVSMGYEGGREGGRERGREGGRERERLLVLTSYPDSFLRSLSERNKERGYEVE